MQIDPKWLSPSVELDAKGKIKKLYEIHLGCKLEKWNKHSYRAYFLMLLMMKLQSKTKAID